MDKLPKEYLEGLIDGYYKKVNGEDCLKPEFIVKYPKEIAKGLEDDYKNKLSQIWKFYDHTRKIQDSLKQKVKSFEAIEAELNMLKPAATYAANRGTVTYFFKDFIEENVSQIKDMKDLEAFIKHFQALIAYLPRKNQK